MERFRIKVEGQAFEVEVLGDPSQDQVQVRVDGELLTAEVVSLATPQMAQTAATSDLPKDDAPAQAPASRVSSPGDANRMTAPLPGTILRVSVRSGQAVQVGDELLIIEAMKMNNVIRSPRNGTIGEVFVQEGEKVAHGSPLLSWAQ